MNKKPDHFITCKQCSIQFKDYPCRKTIYCSKQCRMLGRKVVKFCPICNNTFYSHRQSHIFCSNKCKFSFKTKKIQTICLYCDKIFLAKNYKVGNGEGKFCSKKCSNQFNGRKGEKSYVWKGDNVGYYGIHSWLKTNFGNANTCEQCGITGQKINRKWNIEWAKLRGKEYERKRENFWQLCISCHRKYDLQLTN